jgi:hypothetical protein
MDGPASPDEKMLSKVIVYDFDNPGNGVVAVNVAPLSSFPSEGELLLHPCLTFAKVAPIKYLAHYGNPSIQEKVVLVCTNAPGPLTEFYSADIQKLRNKLMTLCENQAFKQLLALVGHDPQLDEMNDLIFSSIYETATQMKKINAYVIDHIDTSDQAQLAELHQKLQGHSEISYIFTRDNQIFFLNKEMNTLENLKVIQQTFNEIVDDLDLDEHLLSLKNNDPVLTDVPVDLVRMNYLKKMLNQKDYNFHHTVQESIAKLQNTLGIIDAHYNQLDPQTQQLLQDFSRELSALQKKAHSKLQRAPAHLSIFSPPKPVGQSPQMVVKGNTRTFMVI